MIKYDTKKKQINLIKELINVQEKDIMISNEGETGVVYLIDNAKICFKFPRNEISKQELVQERKILDLLKNEVFDISIPVINWVDDETNYIGYYGVSGNLLKYTDIFSYSNEEKEQIGKQLGKFIGKLHSINFSSKNIKHINYFTDKMKEKYNLCRVLLNNYFTQGELKKLDKYYFEELPKEIIEMGERVVLCHGDLGYYNILLSNKKVGVIDFGDSGLQDEAIDYSGLEDDIIRESAICNSGEDNENLRRKIDLRRNEFAILELGYYISVNDADRINKWINYIRNRIL